MIKLNSGMSHDLIPILSWKMEIIHNSIRFKQIKDFPNYYISKCGKVLSTKKHNGSNIRLLKSSLSYGYRRIHLQKNNITHNKFLHRLIAETFIPNLENKRTINHINGIRDDNRIENLEWNTYSENHSHAYKVLGKKANTPWKGKFGKIHPRSRKIAQYDKQDIFIKNWDCIDEVVKELNILSSSISNCLSGLSKSAGGFKWVYI